MKLCYYCHSKFKENSNAQKFCSKECQKKNKNKPLKITYCVQCHGLYITHTNIKKYCSDKCRKVAKSRRVAKPTLNKKCKVCREDFRAIGKSRTSIYCSEDCRRQRWKNKLVPKNCPVCQKNFTADKRTTTCSKKCSIVYFDTKVELKCIICGKFFSVYKSRINREKPTKCCSNLCYRKSRKTGKSVNCKCDLCGKLFYKAPSLQQKHRNNFCSHKCMGTYYSKHELFAGENSPTYIGSFDKNKKYYGANWRSQRKAARYRDNLTCQRCGITEQEYGQELSIHHIIPFIAFQNSERANELENLISLCEPCHRIEHSGKNHPTKYKVRYNIIP